MRNPIMRFRTNKNENFPDWSEIKLSDLGSFYRGLTYSGSNVVDDSSKFLVIRSSNIVKDWFVDCSSNLQFVDMVVPDSLKLQNEDLVICTANGSLDLVGKNAIYRGENEGKVTWGAFCSVFRGKAPLAKYIFRTNRYYRAIQKLKQGGNGALGNLNVNDLKGLTFFFPTDKNESEKIASFFSTLDEKIELSKHKLEALEQLKKGLMQKIFSQEVRFKDSKGNDYCTWKNCSLSDISEPLSYGLNAAASEFDGLHKYLRITDIDERTYQYLSSDPVSPSVFPEEKYRLKEGDIVFARTGNSVGKTYLYDKNDGDLYYAGFLIKAHIRAGICPYFVFLQTQTPKYKNWVRIMSQRSGQPGINAEEYGKYQFLLPCLEEQEKITSLFRTLDKKIFSSIEEIKVLKQLKKGFMQQMFV